MTLLNEVLRVEPLWFCLFPFGVNLIRVHEGDACEQIMKQLLILCGMCLIREGLLDKYFYRRPMSRC